MENEHEIEISSSDIQYDDTSDSEYSPQNKPDIYKTYQDTLNAIFNKIKYYYSKHQALPHPLSSFLPKYVEQIASDKANSTLNADKYYIYIKQSFELDVSNTTLIEFVLDKLIILYKENLLLGTTYVHVDSLTSTPTPTRVINVMIISITKFKDINDKSIWKHVLTLLNHIHIRNEDNNIINNDALCNMLSFSAYVYNTSTNNDILTLSKQMISDIVYKTFTKMERYAERIIIKHNDFYKSIFDTTTTTNVVVVKCETPLSKYIQRRITCMVDQIVIALSSTSSTSLLLDKSHITYDQLQLIPLTVNDITTTAKYDTLRKAKLDLSLCGPNETQPGYFGWCYICRKPCDYYDRETRLPVCSIQCKRCIRQETRNITKHFHNEIVTNEECLQYYFNTCLRLFTTMCKMVNTTDNTATTSCTVKLKSTSTELLLRLFEHYGKVLNKSKEYIAVIKHTLIENMLTNCISDDHMLFKQTINLFFRLWSDFKTHLKQEIAVFNETVFLKILDSNNSSYEHKLCILENFETQAKTEQYYVELYANYDCDKNENFLVNRIVSVLGKIGQGKYLKGDHMLTSVQENILKTKALLTLVTLVKSLYTFTVNHIKDTTSTTTTGVNTVINTNTNTNTNVNTNDVVVDSNNNIINDNETFITENDSFVQQHSMNTNIDKNIEEKYKYEKAKVKFNIRFTKGISYLINEGLISTSSQDQQAQDIASFMRMNLHLNKAQIGEILGDNSQLNLRVLKYYTDSFNFKDISFLQALRDYLFTFQLPGEGQKIDRILEAFSNKYNNDNPSAFANKDATYFLAFTTILLQTDMHNPNVKNKMDFDAFVNLLNADVSTKCISKEYLKEIYDDIKVNPISLPELDQQKEEKLHSKDDKIRLEALRILKEIKLRLRKVNVTQYLTQCSFDYVKPLVNSLWSALLAVFSVILEETENETLYTLCYEGMTETIALLSLLGLVFEKEAFVKALCKVTNLSMNKELSTKNIECIKRVIQVALMNAAQPLFKNCWKTVFIEVVSQLQFYLDKRSDKESNNVLMKNKCECLYKVIQSECVMYDSSSNSGDSSNTSGNGVSMSFFFVNVDNFDNVYLDDFIKHLCDSAKEDLLERQRSFLFEMLQCIMIRCIHSKSTTPNAVITWHKIWKHYSSLITSLILDDNTTQDASLKYLLTFISFTKEYIAASSTPSTKESAVQLSLSFYNEFISALTLSHTVNTHNKQLSYIKQCIHEFILCYMNEYTVSNVKCLLMIVTHCYNVCKGECLFIFDLMKCIFDKVIKRYYTAYKKDMCDMYECMKLFIDEYPEKVITMITDIVYLNLNTHDNDISPLMHSLFFFVNFYNDKRDNIHSLATHKLFDIITDIIKHKSSSLTSSIQTLPTTLYNSGNSSNSSFQLTETFFTSLMNTVLIRICNVLKSKYNDIALTEYVNAIFDLMKHNETLFMKHNLHTLIHLIKSLCIDKEEKLAVAGTECLKIFLNPKHKITYEHVIPSYPSMLYECLIDTFEETEQKGFFTLHHDEISKSENIPQYKAFITSLVLKSILRYQIMTHIQTFLKYFMHTLTQQQLTRLSNAFKASYEDAIRFNNNFELRKAIAKHYIEGSKNPFWLLIQQDTSIKEYFGLLNETTQIDETLSSAIEILNHFLTGVHLLDIETSFNGNDIDCERDDIDNEEYEDGEEIVEEEEEDEDKKEENENAKDKHNMVYHLMLSLTNIVLPKLKCVMYWKYEKYRKDITELLIKCISCADKGMKRLVQELLLAEFYDRYSDK